MDPSQGMIEAAQATLKSGISPLLGDSATEQSINAAKQSSINYVQGSAENLSHLNANSIDLVTAGNLLFPPLRPWNEILGTNVSSMSSNRTSSSLVQSRESIFGASQSS